MEFRGKKEAGRPLSDGASISLGVSDGATKHVTGSWDVAIYFSEQGEVFFPPFPRRRCSFCHSGEPQHHLPTLRSQVVFGSSLRTRNHPNQQGGDTFKKKKKQAGK